jgi:NAD(P)-dependent dehydrogenase (short-subunit alcohol dehydrogenase family)
MKILVIGSSGTIGSAVVTALSSTHEVVGVHRKSSPSVDIQDPASIAALFDRVTGLDHVISCAGGGAWKPLAQLTDEDFASSLGYKLMGQVNIIRHALKHLRDGGSVTVTSGYLAQHPIPNAAAIAMVNSGLEGFVRGAAVEAERGVRVNVVSPPWINETLVAWKMTESGIQGIDAAVCAKAYAASIEGSQTGATIDARSFA